MTAPVSLIASARLIWKILAKVPMLTRWFLRWRYPTGKCRELLLIDLDGSQARFELFAARPSHELTNLTLRAHNHLPFDVTIDIFRVTAFIQSHQFLDAPLNAQLLIPSSVSAQSHLPDITLNEQQKKWVRELDRDCTDVRVELHCRCRSSIQNWEDSRSFVFLASINADSSQN